MGLLSKIGGIAKGALQGMAGGKGAIGGAVGALGGTPAVSISPHDTIAHKAGTGPYSTLSDPTASTKPVGRAVGSRPTLRSFSGRRG